MTKILVPHSNGNKTLCQTYQPTTTNSDYRDQLQIVIYVGTALSSPLVVEGKRTEAHGRKDVV